MVARNSDESKQRVVLALAILGILVFVLVYRVFLHQGAQRVVVHEGDARRDLDARYRNDATLAALYADLLPEALSGNRTAEYFVGAIARDCEATSIAHRSIWNRDPVSTPRGALVLGEDRRQQVKRCLALSAELRESDTEWLEWMERSAAQGYPRAQAAVAMHLYATHQRSGVATAAGTSSDEAPDRARSLLRAAIRSKEPDVLFAAANLQHLLFDARSVDSFVVGHGAWMLVACKRGFDCSPTAPWHVAICRHDPECDPAADGVSTIRRRAGPRVEDIVSKADAIDRSLSTDDWEGLGIGAHE